MIGGAKNGGGEVRKLIFVLVLLLLAPSAKGAEVSCLRQYKDGKHCKTMLLRGEIQSGDYSKFEHTHIANQPYGYALVLQSPGGDAEEAMKIGRLLRRYSVGVIAPSPAKPPRIEGVVERAPDSFMIFGIGNPHPICAGGSDCVCASACALIFFGSPKRFGTVGLHRPHFTGTSFKQLSPTEAAQAYRPALQSVTAYLEEMETPKAVIEAMINTHSTDIRWYNSVLPEERAPSFAEWQDANCGTWNKDDFRARQEMNETCKRTDNRTACRSAAVLAEKDEKRGECIRRLNYEHSLRLAGQAMPNALSRADRTDQGVTKRDPGPWQHSGPGKAGRLDTNGLPNAGDLLD